MTGKDEIQLTICNYLRQHKWYCIKISETLSSHKGIADLYALKGGRSLWIKTKTPGAANKQSPDQATFGCAITAHGGEYLVAESVEDVQKYILEVPPPWCIIPTPQQRIWQ